MNVQGVALVERFWNNECNKCDIARKATVKFVRTIDCGNLESLKLTWLCSYCHESLLNLGYKFTMSHCEGHSRENKEGGFLCRECWDFVHSKKTGSEFKEAWRIIGLVPELQ